MIPDTARELRIELDRVDVAGISLRFFLEKLLDRLIELEDIISEKQDRPATDHQGLNCNG